MKNGLHVQKLNKCHYCNLNGFFCETPMGHDYTTCPCCNGYDYISCSYDLNPIYFDEYNDDNDMRNLYYYCSSCKIIYKLGCTHSSHGCTDDVYNCHLIKKWKNKITNIEYDGMPFFDSNEDWFKHVNDVEVLQMYCPHKGNHCSKTRDRDIINKCNLNNF
jgi:hypothetical protein